MKQNRLIILTLFMLSSQLLLCQDKHITYLGNIFFLSYTKNEYNKLESIYDKKKGYHNILVFKNKKAVSYRFDTIPTRIDSVIKKHHYDVTLFNKKKNKTRFTSFVYNEKKGEFYFNKSIRDWHENLADLKPDYDPESNYMKLLSTKKGSNIKFKTPIVEYTDKTKNIKGYHCKNAIVNSYNDEYNVWYTEEIDYHWCFADFNYLLSGTPIMIYYKGEPYLEFVSIEDIDYNKIYIDNKVIDFVLENWNKEIIYDYRK